MSAVIIPERDSDGKIIQSSNRPFVSKSLPDGKKLYRRVHGLTTTLAAEGDTTVEFTVPHPTCKITEAKLEWFPEGVTVDIIVLDTVDGLIQQSMGVPAGSITPNLELNQFGFNVPVAKDTYCDKSEYDADLIQNMKIKVIMHNSTTATKTVGITFVLHETK